MGNTVSSFGDELRRERELRRISLREVADATKINLRYLEALERNDFEHLPGGIFNRGFVKAYAQFIGIDAETMVTAYIHEAQNQQAEERPSPGFSKHASSSGTGRSVQPTESSGELRSLVIRGAILALGALVLIIGGWWLVTTFISDDAQPPNETQEETAIPAEMSGDDS
jgi:cytoskeleton protein RodZ